MDNLNGNANGGERHDANNIVQQALFIISCTKMDKNIDWGKFVIHFSLLIWTSFIGQLVHPVGGMGRG